MSDENDGLAPFDALYRASQDPWSTDSRWYEARKRALLLAALPSRRFASAYEAGCGNGNLTEELAARCDQLIASDGSDEAVRLARARLDGIAHVAVVRHVLPLAWPSRRFDLIVLSEVLYFLSPQAIETVARRARESIEADGTIVACNWLAPIEGYGQTGDEAHQHFARSLDLPTMFEYRDADVVIGGWTPTGASVATREGIR